MGNHDNDLNVAKRHDKYIRLVEQNILKRLLQYSYQQLAFSSQSQQRVLFKARCANIHINFVIALSRKLLWNSCCALYFFQFQFCHKQSAINLKCSYVGIIAILRISLETACFISGIKDYNSPVYCAITILLHHSLFHYIGPKDMISKPLMFQFRCYQTFD